MMLFTPFVDQLARNHDELRRELKEIIIKSNYRKLHKDIGIASGTFYSFLNGKPIWPRTAWRIAHFIEKEKWRFELGKKSVCDKNSRTEKIS